MGNPRKRATKSRASLNTAGMAAAVFASLAMPVQAEEGFKGIHLYNACNGVYGRPDDKTICLAYIRGFSEGLYMGIYVGVMTGEAGKRSCFPNPKLGEPINPEQAELIVKKFLADNPHKLHEPAFILAFEALSAAFPCRPKR